MDGAFRGDLHQLGALLWRQGAGQLDLHVDSVEHALFGGALLTILRVDPRVPERDGDISSGICFRRIKPAVMDVQAPSRLESIIRIWTRIPAAGAQRFDGSPNGAPR